jgi:alpha-L-arabinofuranosidase
MDIELRLVSKKLGVIAKTTITNNDSGWKKLNATLTPTNSAADASLEIQLLKPGTVALDVISLFPRKTYKNRKNGLRPDLAEAIAAIHPKFVRFPGGCVAHGDGLDNLSVEKFYWKH